jgi:YVTN family beta-propeller protein
MGAEPRRAGRAGGVVALTLTLAGIALVALGIGLLPADRTRAADPARRAVYVGVKACASCHDGPHRGDQTARWLASKHARAYAALARPEARRIAAISGVPVEPLESPLCLGCHATAADAEEIERDETFALHEGVQCEKCHGPGSAHVDALSSDGPAVAGLARGLAIPSAEDCLACHREKPSHANVLGPRPFDVAAALKATAHPTPAGAPPPDPDAVAKPTPAYEEYARMLAAVRPDATAGPPNGEGDGLRYRTPINLAIRPGARELYVTCEAAGAVDVVDLDSSRKVAEIRVGGQPMDVTFRPDGRVAYVTNRLDDSLSVVDAATRTVTATVPVGDEPHGVRTDAEGKFLYVANTSSDDISVIDATALVEVRRLSAGRSPWALALSPDGTRFAVTNAQSRFVPLRESSRSEVTLIDAARGVVEDRPIARDANLVQGVAWHPSGRFALTTLLRTKNLVPMTRMLQGWTVTNGLGIVRADAGTVDQVLLDEPDGSFPDPTGVAITPDGTTALVTSAGADRVAVVDLGRLLAIVEGATPEDRAEVLPNHLGPATEFVVARVPTGTNPRGIAIAPDGATAYVACALDDAITVIDLRTRAATGRIDLGGPAEITLARRGERLFNGAGIAFRRQLSCHTCHPDGHVDGLTYDIEADGIGRSPVDNRTLRGILDTGPFKWEGTNPSLSRQCGPRLSVYFTRIQPFTPDELVAIDHYISTIPRPPNRHRAPGAPLSPAQRRGKLLFERTTTVDGREIPKALRCASCHFPPLYTDRRRHVVGDVMDGDVQASFDVPHLNNIYDSAPYLHNGVAASLEEIWTKYNPKDQHGVTNDMTKDQLNDLIEYLKTL